MYLSVFNDDDSGNNNIIIIVIILICDNEKGTCMLIDVAIIRRQKCD